MLPVDRSPLTRLVAALRAARALLRESLGGETRDYTALPVPRAALLLAIPMILEMAMESLFVIVDLYFVAGLGAEAVAAVGLTEAVLTIVYALGLGLGMGATALVARRVGEGNAAAAREVAAQTLWVGVLVATVLCGLGAMYAVPILEAMGASPAVVAVGSGYARVMLAGSGTIACLFLFNGAWRGAGDAALAMRVMWLANGLNILLVPCLIHGLGPFPALGVTGAAVATTCGRACGVALQLLSFADGGRRLGLSARDLLPRPRVMFALLRVAFGGIAQLLVATSSWVVLMRLVAPHGSAAVAGYTIAIRLLAFSLLPAWGLANAAATLVGQHLGAGQPAHAERAVWQVAGVSALVMLVVGLLSMACAPALVGFFTDDPAVRAQGVSCLRIVAAGYGFYAVGMIVTQAFNGAGDTTTPTLVNLVGFWLLQIPLAWALAAPLGLGSRGVFFAVLGAETFIALLAAGLFRRGRWKLKGV